MSARPVQISMDVDLLREIDRDPETIHRGRSAFIRSAIQLYLTAKRRRLVEERITQAYNRAADDMLDEVADFLDGQAWPTE